MMHWRTGNKLINIKRLASVLTEKCATHWKHGGGGRVEKHTSGMQRVITEYDTYRRRGACEHLQGVEYMFISSCLTTGAAGESL